ncbi:MAG TPA: hypothetical protein VEU08_08800, partial [Vicinamibacterales bacterium]|nr:hypothetical protein [Vicinamibacterales bacterium]
MAEAASREDMAARLSETMPRLVVAEWGLPGDQASKQWFDMLRWSDVPVILIANTEDETQPLPEGAAGVLKKPFSLSDM